MSSIQYRLELYKDLIQSLITFKIDLNYDKNSLNNNLIKAKVKINSIDLKNDTLIKIISKLSYSMHLINGSIKIISNLNNRNFINNIPLKSKIKIVNLEYKSMIKKIFPIIKNKITIDKLFDIFKINIGLIDLLTLYIKNNLKENIKYKRMAIKHIFNNYRHKSISKNPIQLQTYGLTSIHKKMSLDNILKITTKCCIGGNCSDPYSYKNFDPFFKSKNIGVLVMIRIVKTQINYNMRPFIKDSIDILNSVSERTLKYYNVISDINNNHHNEYDNLLLGDKLSDKWLIIRTLNGTDYDIMTDRSSTEIFVDKTIVDKIKSNKNSNIIINYNKIMCKKFQKKILNIDYKPIDKHKNEFKKFKTDINGFLKLFYYKKIKENIDLLDCKQKAVIYLSKITSEEITIIIEKHFNSIFKNINYELKFTYMYSKNNLISPLINYIKQLIETRTKNIANYKLLHKTRKILLLNSYISSILKDGINNKFNSKKNIFNILENKSILLS